MINLATDYKYHAKIVNGALEAAQSHHETERAAKAPHSNAAGSPDARSALSEVLNGWYRVDPPAANPSSPRTEEPACPNS